MQLITGLNVFGCFLSSHFLSLFLSCAVGSLVSTPHSLCILLPVSVTCVKVSVLVLVLALATMLQGKWISLIHCVYCYACFTRCVWLWCTSVISHEQIIPPSVQDDQKQEEEPTSFTVKLVKYKDDSKIKLIKEIKTIMEGMNLVQVHLCMRGGGRRVVLFCRVCSYPWKPLCFLLG